MIAIQRTAEYDRIAALPRRSLSLDDAREWAIALTALLALRPGVALRPWQAIALREAVLSRGAWLVLAVGAGKTLITWLLPVVMRAIAPLLIVPAALGRKTESDYAALRLDWRAPAVPPRIVTREYLSTVAGAHTLAEYSPDLIVIDESDALANASSACARRIDRYLREHDVAVVALTGTPTRRSIMGYWHLLAWCLGDAAPVPLVESEALLWAEALDDHARARPRPGVLGATLPAARAWYRDRLLDTPGVVVVDEDSCDAPLTVRVRCARDCAVIDAAFERFAIEWESPGGVPVSDPLSRWLLDAQLGLGLYTQWDPPPPAEWRDARRAVARFVRERIAASTTAAKPLDTEAQVLRRYEQHPTVRAWQEVRGTFAGATETVWMSDATLESVRAWLGESSAPAVVWCGSVAFAERLAERTGLSYYGQRGVTADGAELHCASPGGSLIASWCANKRGFCLDAWTRALVVMPPQSAKWLEQIIGRLHRSGQTRHVRVDLLATSGGTLDSFATALGEASFARATCALTQKLLRADIVWDAPTTRGVRWARAS